MPLVDVRTSATATPLVQGQLLEDVVTITANLFGKSREITMGVVTCDLPIYFRANREPAALVAVRAIGLPPKETRATLALELSRLLDEVLDIPPNRTFVTFEAIPADQWGVDGKLLG